MANHDTLGRPLVDLRISVTDRCNFRCGYCMPQDEYEWIERGEILTFEETERLARIFVALGVERIRVTGGEPLVRRDLERLVAALARIEGLCDLSLTTNGALLEDKAAALRRAGLRRLNVSLDSLRPERFRAVTKRGDLDRVLSGLEAARRVGFDPIKINTVVIRGVNEDEILPMAEFARQRGHAIRFIEYMDVGNANGWSLEKTVPKLEIHDAIHRRHPLRELGRTGDRAPAVDYEYEDGGGTVGIIGSVTEPFCASCSRARLTAEGRLVTCLFARDGYDLKTPMRSGAADSELAERIRSLWSARADRHSEVRWAGIRSGRGYSPGAHRKIEMIRLGG